MHNAEAIQVRLEDEPIDIPHLGRNNHVNADLEADADQDAELEGDAVAGPTVIAHVDLAKKSGEWSSTFTWRAFYLQQIFSKTDLRRPPRRSNW